MVRRTWWGALWFVFSALLFAPAHGATNSDRVPGCEERKRDSMEQRLGGAKLYHMEEIPRDWGAERVTVSFVQIEFSKTPLQETLSYGCQPIQMDDPLPAYAGFAWMIVMSNEVTFSLVGLPSGPSATDTTIRTYLDEKVNRASPAGGDALRILVSGPFWKLGRYGESPIGALIRDGNVEQYFRSNFSAKHVLCSNPGTGVDLLVGREGMFGERETQKCAAAFQVGPAFFEKPGPDTDFGRAKLGIGSNSMNRSRRNILMRTEGNRSAASSKGSLIILSTLFEIASYDAMVASELLVRKMPDLGEIVWAVGLVDDESLGGPALAVQGNPSLELAEVDRPTGAIVQFIVD